MDSACFPLGCLHCDKPTAGDSYCSQACRLADFDTSSVGSEPASPTNSSAPAARSPTNGFYLPPAIDFNAYRRSPPPSGRSSRPTSGYFSTALIDSPPSPRVLSPSSSRTSLKNDALSRQVQSELMGYTNSFDQVRDWRRKMASS